MRYVRLVMWTLSIAIILWISITAAGNGSGDDIAIDSTPNLCQQTSVILVGANGDLAKRYLWPAIFSVARHTANGQRFVVIGGTRTALLDSELRNLVESSVLCTKGDSECSAAREAFLRQVLPHQLKTEKDYQGLSEQLEKLALEQHCAERGRLFYLAIPPFAFGPTSELIARSCRLSGAWLRVVFEKPFGRDLKSAQELSSSLTKHLAEHEILRVDHYLGKTTVASMLDIRRAIEKVNGDIWNGQHIRRIDIVVKETLDVAGRTGYYNHYGVIRDMLQNHLTELMALTAMNVDDSMGKVTVLRHVKPPTGKDVLIGQYQSFNDHLRQDVEDMVDESHTPTFATALLWLSGSRWKGVPFRLTSGKMMDERIAYVRILFQNLATAKLTCQREVLFHIQGGEFGQPCVVISKGLLKHLPVLPDRWQWDNAVQLIKGCPVHVAKPRLMSEPYSQIVQGAVNGNMQLFVNTASLLASWHIWSHLLKSEPYVPLRMYDRALVKAGYLNTIVEGSRIRFAIDDKDLPLSSEFQASQSPQQMFSVPSSFAGSNAVHGELSFIMKKLADDMVAVALEAIKQRGAFHVAFPGGKSPLPLFQLLAFDSGYINFPWQYTHLWQTDERCVSDTFDGGRLSNFVQISLALLQYVSVPANHLHRMPVRLSSGLCSPKDKGHLAYEAELGAWNATLIDLVVLGVGSDGHVASLFPGVPVEKHLLVDKVCRPGVEQTTPGACRMTLTNNALSAARRTIFLIHGHGKRSIVQQIRSDTLADESKLPAVQVASSNLTKVTWYIDDKAFR